MEIFLLIFLFPILKLIGKLSIAVIKGVLYIIVLLILFLGVIVL